MAKGPEAEVKDQIRAYLKSIGAYQFWPVQMGYGNRTVDCLACIDGRFFAIEVKRADTRPEPTGPQQQCLKEVDLAGGISVVAYSVDDVQLKVKTWTDW